MRLLRAAGTQPAWLAVVVALGAYAISTVVRAPGRELVLLDNVLYPAIAVAASGLALRRGPGRGRGSKWLAAAIVSWTAGELYWDLFLRTADAAPVPSWSDVCWLAFYPLAFIALSRLSFDGQRRLTTGVVLDGVVAALGAGALAAAVLVDVIVDATGGTIVEVVVNLAYPLGDLLLLALVIGSAVMGGRSWSPSRWLATTGLLAFATADVIYLFQATRGTYVEGGLLDVGWLVGLVLLAAASLHAERAALAAAPPPVTGVAITAATSFAAMAVLLVGRSGIGRVAFLLALACVATALVRTLVAVREAQSLAGSRQLALTDELTGLGNRRRLVSSLVGAFDAVDDGAVALLIVDLDDFKQINDTLGHSVGDQLLTEVGARLRSALRAGDVLTRQGGDEFAVVLRGARVAEATASAQRLLDQLTQPVVLGDAALRVSASVGIAVAPDHAVDAYGLLQRADVAMYRAKARRTGFAVYSPEFDEHSSDRLRLAVELADAIDRRELVVHYQPIVRLADGAPVLLEALMRWQHPERGQLLPGAFIPVAEQAGLTRRLTEVVLETSLADARSWWALGMDVPVAVNLSGADLLDTALPEVIVSALARHALPGSALVVEIVEDALMGDVEQVRTILEVLRQHGVRVAVDDFGTGHSSLGRIWELPVDELKLDRSFVTRMCEDPRPAAIVRAAVALAETFSLTVVAEGVEDERTLEALRAVGCDLAQGWHVATPMPLDAITDWLLGRAPVTFPVRSRGA